MNLNKLSLASGAITKYSCAIVALTSVLISYQPAQAKTTSLTPQEIAQAKPKPPEAIQLKLTPQQITRIRDIRKKTRNEIQNVLTDKQKQEIQAAIAAGQPLQQAFARVNLSSQQKLRLRSIMMSSQKNMESVLTSAQKQQVENYRKKVIQQQKLQQQQKK
ncbi:MAG: Spy/CpxP family protein refolding chaperone [Richelia sp.]|nr:Spy/CpxP family protein refolding chaperone [Richelia sp.]CDN12709.1 hypothetical protein RintRC_4575 [Richelia intracellularis]